MKFNKKQFFGCLASSDAVFFSWSQCRLCVLFGNHWISFKVTLPIAHQRLPCEEKRFY